MVGSVTNVAVEVSGEASLSNLLAIDLATSGMITAADVTTLSGTVTQIQSITSNLGSGSNKFSIGTMLGTVTDVDFTVSGTSLAATNLIAMLHLV
jgi:hypothetical protein